uniref:Uncharacterized protein n=1 Tax=Parascaris univalens TaxID=6257 RepID=A0A915C578_PARUN
MIFYCLANDIGWKFSFRFQLPLNKDENIGNKKHCFLFRPANLELSNPFTKLLFCKS